MRIADSTVEMMSGRSYKQSGAKSGGSSYISSYMNKTSQYGTADVMKKDTYESNAKDKGMAFYNVDDISYFKNLGKVSSGNLFSSGSSATSFQNNTLSSMFGRFASYGMIGGAGMGGYSMNMASYSEVEETGFHANGKALTEDGRTIDFNVDILMSRSYMEYMNVRIPTMMDALFDPLIVNVGSDTADIRDQTFKFDLDADGKEDEISMLGRGSGFLALDKDGNGKIDDGNELFGTKSGDGFGDLREYDSDGNGWIDENDEVFEKLRVWCKDENGNDILMNLKECDIGAIYLGEQQTEFTMGGVDGIRDGVVRSTGVFLRESSGAGTIQHVDMAMKQEGMGIRVSGEQTISYETTSPGRTGQSNSARRREESRRRNERIMKKRAQQRAAEKIRMEKRMEQKAHEEKLQQERIADSEEQKNRYLDSIQDEQISELCRDHDVV